MTQRRFAGLDIMRGIAIMAIIIVHRAHYSWSGMQNRAILGKYFASPWAPLVILAIALFTMAGVFYVISGLVNAYALQGRVTTRRSTPAQAMKAGVITGLWIIALNYIQRIFFMNGMVEGMRGAEPEFPIGQLTGLVRTGGFVSFRWSQVTEPGTLWVIGAILISVSLTLGLMLRNPGEQKPARIYWGLSALGAVTLIASPFVKYALLPVYTDLYAAGRYGLALLVGFVSQEFGVFPYLGYGFLAAIIGVGLARGEELRAIRKRAHVIALVLFVVGLLGVVIASRKDPLGERIIGAGVCYIELAVFLFLTGLALRLWDFAAPAVMSRRQERWVGVRRFGMLALSVYTLEPLLAEILTHLMNALFGRAWADNLLAVLAFGLICLLSWWGVLVLWGRRDFIGSAERLSAGAVAVLTGKRSGKVAFETLHAGREGTP